MTAETYLPGKNTFIRVDAQSKLTAKSEFIDDIEITGILHGATVRCPVPHAKIHGISNLNEIMNMPGVVTAVTSQDIKGINIVPFVKQDFPCLADNRARFYGQPVALVAANTRDQAVAAAGKAAVVYEELPGVFNSIDALKPGAVNVSGNDNIHSQFRLRKGNIDKGFSEADVIVERVYYNKHQVHCYLENQGIISGSKQGNQKLFRINKTCLFYNGIKELTLKTYGAKMLLKKAVENISEISLSLIYGSYAKNTMRADSDIDLLAVGACAAEEALLDEICRIEKKIQRLF